MKGTGVTMVTPGAFVPPPWVKYLMKTCGVRSSGAKAGRAGLTVKSSAGESSVSVVRGPADSGVFPALPGVVGAPGVSLDAVAGGAAVVTPVAAAVGSVMVSGGRTTGASGGGGGGAAKRNGGGPISGR